jgi:hypothetical protein
MYMTEEPLGANNIGPFDIQNISGATIASDTVWLWVWALKAQVSNPPGIPVQQQAASGEFGSIVTSGDIVLATPTISYILLNAGTPPQMRALHVTLLNNASTFAIVMLYIDTGGAGSVRDYLGFYYLSPAQSAGCTVTDHFIWPDGHAFSGNLVRAVTGGTAGWNVTASATTEGVTNAATPIVSDVS